MNSNSRVVVTTNGHGGVRSGAGRPGLSVAAHKRRGTFEPARHSSRAVCQWCDRGYRPALKGCLGVFVFDGERLERIPFNDEDADTRCPDCGVGVGQLHHGHCTEEECASCGALMDSCSCDPEVWGP
jgi:hypothetical protein